MGQRTKGQAKGLYAGKIYTDKIVADMKAKCLINNNSQYIAAAAC